MTSLLISCCIQEHRFVHNESDPDIVARDLGWSTLFTASAIRNDIDAAIYGVGIAINSKILPLLLSVKKVYEKIYIAKDGKTVFTTVKFF